MNRQNKVVGNWKMTNGIAKTIEFGKAFLELYNGSKLVDVAIAPPLLSMTTLKAALLKSDINIGAQNVHYKPDGAFTGEISTSMLTEAGVNFVILGHSERRQEGWDTNETVAAKTAAALSAGISPIVCVGETVEQYRAKQTESVILKQIADSLPKVSPDELAKITVAYEPIWAIGTGETAEPETAQEVHNIIRRKLGQISGSNAVATGMSILYGGSVKPENIADLMSQPDINGALVGGASLKADSFYGIIAGAEAALAKG